MDRAEFSLLATETKTSAQTQIVAHLVFFPFLQIVIQLLG
jgi:hypothetical protein